MREERRHNQPAVGLSAGGTVAVGCHRMTTESNCEGEKMSILRTPHVTCFAVLGMQRHVWHLEI